MNKEEHEIQAGVVKWATWLIKDYPDLDCLMAFSNERRGGVHQSKLKGSKATRKKEAKLAILKEISYFIAEGMKPGAPDLFLSVPKNGYPGFYLETKAPGGRLSKEQRRMRLILIARGYKYSVYRSIDEGKKLIKEYLNILEDI